MMTFKLITGLCALMLGMGSMAQAEDSSVLDAKSACGRAVGAFWKAEAAAAYREAIPARTAKIGGNLERDNFMYFKPGDSGLPDVDFLDPAQTKGLLQLFASGRETLTGMWLVVVPNNAGEGYRGQVFVGVVNRGKEACAKAYNATQRIGLKELPEGYLDRPSLQ